MSAAKHIETTVKRSLTLRAFETFVESSEDDLQLKNGKLIMKTPVHLPLFGETNITSTTSTDCSITLELSLIHI